MMLAAPYRRMSGGSYLVHRSFIIEGCARPRRSTAEHNLEACPRRIDLDQGGQPGNADEREEGEAWLLQPTRLFLLDRNVRSGG
jgi:hypothetical protein